MARGTTTAASDAATDNQRSFDWGRDKPAEVDEVVFSDWALTVLTKAADELDAADALAAAKGFAADDARRAADELAAATADGAALAADNALAANRAVAAASALTAADALAANRAALLGIVEDLRGVLEDIEALTEACRRLGRPADVAAALRAWGRTALYGADPSGTAVGERLNAVYAGKRDTALTRLWRHRPHTVVVERRRDRRILPVFKLVEPEGVLPSLAAHWQPDPSDAPMLPLWQDQPIALRVPLLDLVDRAGVPVMTRGRGAPLALRLFVAIMLSVRHADRPLQSVRITKTLGDLTAAVYPNGWRSNHWPKLSRCLIEASSYAIHDGRARWFPLSVRRIPDHPDLSGEVAFDVAFPPGVANGPSVDLPELRQLSVTSGARWRAYIAGRSILWNEGFTRVPRGRRRQGYGWAQDPNAYSVVTAEDRRRLAFGAGDRKHRRRSEVDAVWSDLPGLQVFDRRAVDERTGAIGWRILPAEVVLETGGS